MQEVKIEGVLETYLLKLLEVNYYSPDDLEKLLLNFDIIGLKSLRKKLLKEKLNIQIINVANILSNCIDQLFNQVFSEVKDYEAREVMSLYNNLQRVDDFDLLLENEFKGYIVMLMKYSLLAGDELTFNKLLEYNDLSTNRLYEYFKSFAHNLSSGEENLLYDDVFDIIDIYELNNIVLNENIENLNMDYLTLLIYLKEQAMKSPHLDSSLLNLLNDYINRYDLVKEYKKVRILF